MVTGKFRHGGKSITRPCGTPFPSRYSAGVAHRTAARATEFEEVVEGSRFLALVRSIANPEEAAELLERARREHPDATHHCWAYRVGEAQRFSDDGEPGGTAGRPMLEVILKRDLDHVAAVVVRYFGGKKLGAGGLVRAYSGAVAKALDAAGVREVVDMRRLAVRAPFAQVDAVLRAVDELVARHPDAARSEAEFDGDGLVIDLVVPLSDAAGAASLLVDLTRGAATVTEVDA